MLFAGYQVVSFTDQSEIKIKMSWVNPDLIRAGLMDAALQDISNQSHPLTDGLLVGLNQSLDGDVQGQLVGEHRRSVASQVGQDDRYLVVTRLLDLMENNRIILVFLQTNTERLN